MFWQLSLLIGIISGGFAAAMAFLITYDEYSRHDRMGREDVIKQAGHAALMTSLFFVVLSVVIGLWIGALLQPARAPFL